MKTKLIHNRAGIAFAALVASIGLTQSANAILLVYEEGPNAGQPFSPGPVEFKFQNFDNGTSYLPGSSGGYTGSPGAGVAVGIGVVNLIPGQTPAGNAFPGTIVPASPEDSWGILRVETIIDANTGFKIWTSSVKGTEITGTFHGEQDFFVQPDPSNPLTDVRINGAGLKLDLWEQPLGISNWNPALGPGARINATDYPTVSGPGEGTLVLSLQSTPGFIHTNGTAGGSASEFESIFNFNALSGLGTSFLNVVGGTQGGSFDTNGVTSPSGVANFGAGIIPSPFADIRANFTAQPGFAGWQVRSQDPLAGNYVPEPATFLTGVGCLLPILLGRRRNVVKS